MAANKYKLELELDVHMKFLLDQVDIYADEERAKQAETQELLDEEMQAVGQMVNEVGNITEALEEESNLYDNFGDFGGMQMVSGTLNLENYNSWSLIIILTQFLCKVGGLMGVTTLPMGSFTHYDFLKR